MRQSHIIKRHIRNRSTNQIAGNSLFSSEIILILDIRQEIKPFPKIAIMSQKYVVSQIEFVSGQNLTERASDISTFSSHLDLRNRVGEF